MSFSWLLVEWLDHANSLPEFDILYINTLYITGVLTKEPEEEPGDVEDAETLPSEPQPGRSQESQEKLHSFNTPLAPGVVIWVYRRNKQRVDRAIIYKITRAKAGVVDPLLDLRRRTKIMQHSVKTFITTLRNEYMSMERATSTELEKELKPYESTAETGCYDIEHEWCDSSRPCQYKKYSGVHGMGCFNKHHKECLPTEPCKVKKAKPSATHFEGGEQRTEDGCKDVTHIQCLPTRPCRMAEDKTVLLHTGCNNPTHRDCLATRPCLYAALEILVGCQNKAHTKCHPTLPCKQPINM